MKPSIEDVVMQFKHDVSRALSAEFIIAVWQSIGHSWRERQFDPVTTIQGFLLQILHGNTACSAVPRLLGKAVSGEAYGQVRSRLPLEVFQRLLAELCSRLHGVVDDADKWLGHRVWVIDGSSCSTPDVPALQEAFGQPSGQRRGCVRWPGFWGPRDCLAQRADAASNWLGERYPIEECRRSMV